MSRRRARPKPAGATWRLLAWEMTPGGKLPYGQGFEVGSDLGTAEGPHMRSVAAPNTEFDELVVGGFLHVEQMDDRVYWMNVAGLRLVVSLDRFGKPIRLLAELDDPVDGCKYEGDIGDG